jgi:hypothetical protein
MDAKEIERLLRQGAELRREFAKEQESVRRFNDAELRLRYS